MFSIKDVLMDENFGEYEGYASSSAEITKKESVEKKEENKTSDSHPYNDIPMVVSIISSM